MTEDRANRRRITFLLFVAAVVALIATAFGQEVLGWGLFPGGLVGLALLALGMSRRQADRQ
jgi:hypothetical protein